MPQMIYRIGPGKENEYEETSLYDLTQKQLNLIHAVARKTAADYKLKISQGTQDYEDGGEGLPTWEYKEIKLYLSGCEALYKTIELILKTREMGKR